MKYEKKIYIKKKNGKKIGKFVVHCIFDWHAAHEMKRRQIICKVETFHTLNNYKSNYDVTTKYDIKKKKCLLKFLFEK